MVYQVNLNPQIRIHLGGVYAMPSGKFLLIKNQTENGWFCQQVDYQLTCDIPLVLTLSGRFIFEYGQLVCTKTQWLAKLHRVAYEAERVAIMRANFEFAKQREKGLLE